MKKLTTIFCTLVLLAGFTSVTATAAETTLPATAENENAPSDQDMVNVCCSPDLHPLIDACATAFMQENNDIMVNVTPLKDQSIDDMVAAPGHLAFVTKDHMKGVDPQSKRIIVIGREVYVPVMNADNPYRDLVMQQGISPAEFAAIYAGEQPSTWNTVLANNSNLPVHAFRVDDPSFTTYLNDFLHTEGEAIRGNVMESCEAVMQSVQSDRNAIGFCTLTQLKQMETAGTALPVAMVPVDLNDNNELDHFEAIYASVADLSRGIWIGKYTGTLYSRIFALADAATFGGAGQELVSWIIANGNEVLADNGYATLMDNEREAILASLAATPDVGEKGSLAPKQTSIGFLVVLALLGFVVLMIIVLMVFNTRKPLPEEKAMAGETPFVTGSGEVPGGYYFDRSHMWTFLERDGKIRVGLDNFLQKVTGTITKVDLKTPGEKVRKGETIFAMIRNGKRLEIKSPVTGTIVEQNSALAADAGLLNNDPFNEGWIYLVEPVNWVEEFGAYLKGQPYTDWIKNEYVRLKDFFATMVNPATGQKTVLQDGGEVAEGILADLGPEAWEEFQSSFLRN